MRKTENGEDFYENTAAAIGLYTDAVNNREMLVIGEPQEIRLFFKNNTPNDRIFVCDRKLGLIADDLNRISDNRMLERLKCGHDHSFTSAGFCPLYI